MRPNDSWRTNQNQGWNRPNCCIPQVMPRRNLRLMCHEHQRQKYTCLSVQDWPRRRHPVNPPSNQILSNQRPCRGHDPFLQPIQVDQTLPAAQGWHQKLGRPWGNLQRIPPDYGRTCEVRRAVRVRIVRVMPDCVPGLVVAPGQLFGSSGVDASVEVDYWLKRSVH